MTRTPYHLASASSIQARMTALLTLARETSDVGKVGNVIYDLRVLLKDLDATLNAAFTECVATSQKEDERRYGPLISDLQQMIATAEPVANDEGIG